jgi:hypothetical protein
MPVRQHWEHSALSQAPMLVRRTFNSAQQLLHIVLNAGYIRPETCVGYGVKADGEAKIQHN